ncbi:Alpha/Beta hydrolase protein [Rhizophagus irregularis DAOM 181602=DAOM 197198]|nr:Alpha/Beta hydrolase protein [Rhizophagus irregularis DAOM 181602=DAOM 197198]POG79335.1 Alpha/Beta hydrolase protein [Rhizophagus irregularis DAOM 181602=DAOM 197198]|eukprot:XP_025186201.1 Alpha/Beta hydrolase protein [Rhizophagus irregularis DAOM 181602=DAOM 197198]
MSFLSDYIPSYIQFFLTTTSIVALAVTSLLYTYQCKMIYLAGLPEGSRQVVQKPSEFGMNYTDETLTTKDGVRIKAYICKLPLYARDRPTILIFHANAGNMGHRLFIAKEFYVKLEYNVVMLSYRGYGLSEGTPTEKGLRIDSQAILDFILKDEDLKNTKLIAYGQSLGGAVSIDLVSRNEDKFSGMIVENTFLSIPKLIPHVFPLIKYLAFLCHQVWPSEKAIQQIVNVPVLFLSGLNDELVPPSHMRQLYELSQTRTKHWKGFNDGTHNETVFQPSYYDTIEDFIKKEVLKE